MMQPSLFARPDGRPEPKRAGDLRERLRVLITVKAAPNPSDKYGETVCVAGLRVDPEHVGWVRLYPLNFRELEADVSFRKYDIVTLEAVPSRQGDSRAESWRPNWESIQIQGKLPPWKRRRSWLDEHIEGSMCKLNDLARDDPAAKSLALVRPREVTGFEVRSHPGWSLKEQQKIARYLEKLPLVERDYNPTALEAPRFKGWYLYRCQEPSCNGHRQQVLDWEFVRFQRRLKNLDETTIKAELRKKFFDTMCAASRDVAFYVGNQAKRHQIFSTLGVYWPPKP